MREMLVGDDKVFTEFCHLSGMVSVGTTESILQVCMGQAFATFPSSKKPPPTAVDQRMGVI